MSAAGNRWLLLAGAGSVLAALLHFACIIGGPAWYRTLGAGEGIARMAAQGHWYPTAITVAISLVLIGWGLYAWSGAGLIGRLPLLRTALLAITAVYLLRGVAFVLLQPYFPGNSVAFWFWSSAICLALGLLHAVGLRQAWPRLSPRPSRRL
ncbi:hypothetical protein [Aerolutibacter ruishenii]|uniref:Uncharacterized protein n=1 Tax=Aerolutibacter ruishenii TaxID=686800 RepID=A0A562LY76_9GAMM|nr:hypothetical protein [Lysobacter ruishenii]TWI12522.1 hypothetical protein IP93_00863 [Lysobacter ruishenii]